MRERVKTTSNADLRRQKRLNATLHLLGLHVAKQRTHLSSNTPEARAENLRRMAFPWMIVKQDPYATTASRHSEVVSEHRTLDEIADKFGVLLGVMQYQVLDDELLAHMTDWKTRDQLAAELGMEAGHVRFRVRRLIREGRAVVRYRRDSDGRRAKLYLAANAPGAAVTSSHWAKCPDDELLAHLAGWRSVPELVEALGLHPTSVRYRIQQLLKVGVVTAKYVGGVRQGGRPCGVIYTVARAV